jgi:hypothetical protein
VSAYIEENVEPATGLVNPACRIIVVISELPRSDPKGDAGKVAESFTDHKRRLDKERIHEEQVSSC